MNEYRNRSGRRMAQPHQKTGLWTQYRRWVAGLTRAERIRYRLLQGAVIISLIIIAAFLILQSWIRVPELPNVDAEGGDILSGDVSGEMPSVAKSGRKDGMYTFLLVGKDTAGGGNTDTMILLTYDTVNKKMYGLSLPRDTMVNVSTTSKRLNAVYNYNKGKDKSTQVKNGMAALKKEVSRLTGITPDFYVIVEWEAIGKLVDAVGGVEFEVPFDMDYDDPTPGQDLHIHQKAGLRLLSGDDAMQVIRWRKNDKDSPYGYNKGGVGDAGRMELQQNFLKAVIKQMMQPKNVLNIGKIAKVFEESVETDLSFQNILWFGKQAFSGGLSMDNVTFLTMPYKGAAAYSRVYSKQLGKDFYLDYVVPIAGKLLDIVNNQLSPFKEVFTLSDLDIMSVNADGSLSSTTGRVEDSAAAKAPTLIGSGKKDESEKDYITDENGNLVDPDTGEIVTPPSETEPGTETPSETPSEPTPETPATPETPGTGTETTDPSGSTGGETGTGSPETPDQPEDPGIIVVPPEEPATPDANQGLDPVTGEPLPAA